MTNIITADDATLRRRQESTDGLEAANNAVIERLAATRRRHGDERRRYRGYVVGAVISCRLARGEVRRVFSTLRTNIPTRARG